MTNVGRIVGAGSFGRMMGRSRKMNMAMSKAVGRALVKLEREHKTRQIKRSRSSKAKPDPNTWTTRQGFLRRSFHIAWTPGATVGAYGSDLARSELVEEGGEIEAKNKYLAIPTEHAPKNVWPRYVEGLFFYKTKKGKPSLAKAEPGGLKILYHLRESVELPPRPALRRAVEATEREREQMFRDVVEKEMWGRN